VAYPFLFGELTARKHRHDMPPASRHHQLSAISRKVMPIGHQVCFAVTFPNRPSSM